MGSTLVYSTFATQAAIAALLGMVLLGFHGAYRRQYLQYWAASWIALAVYLACAALTFHVARTHAPLDPVRLVPTVLYVVAGYLHLGWLSIGAWCVATGKTVERGWGRSITTAATVVGLALVVVGILMPSPEARLFIRAGLRALFAGICFAVAAWSIARSEMWSGTRGRRLVTVSLALYGLRELHTFAQLAHLAPEVSWESYLGFAELVLMAAMGLGMVIGLYEEERARVVRATEQIEHLAYHDTLTGHPNRRLFNDRLTLALAQAHRGGQRVAVLVLNLDRFKVVNESLGHAVGDELLRALAGRLARAVREGDTVARVAGDEFAIVLTGLARDDDAARVARGVLDEVRRPFHLVGQELFLSASVGVAISPDDGSDAGMLARNAETALSTARVAGRDTIQLYAPEMNERAAERLGLEASLRRALATDELVLHYQPVVDSATGRVDRFEALVRWQHPERGLLPPAEFLPLVEAIGLSDALDQWVLRSACRQARAWRDGGWRGFRVAVNVSARPFQHPEMVTRVMQILRETGLAPEHLELEITETVAMLNAEASLSVLRGLRDLGVHIAIDDFGTGYSSLSYLRNLPVDTLKIDQSFVRDLPRDADAMAVTTAIIALAHSLRMRVVAEGVETPEQRSILERHQCDGIQGYLVSRPMPAEACDRFYTGRRRERATPAGGKRLTPI